MNAENTKQDESSAEQATPQEADDTVLTAEAAANGAETSEHGANACGSEADASDVDAAGSDESEVEGLRLQLQQREDALLRLQAELENLRKRASRDVENAHKFGVEKLVSELLPVKDSMELGLATEEGADVNALREGVQLTDKMLAGVLEKFGVQAVDPTGDAFDPEQHQAMSMQEVQGTPAGRVVTTFLKGYLLNERLERPAMVIVSK